VAVVSPSWGGPAAFPYRYAAGKQQLAETLGVEVVEMPHTLSDPAWISRNPKARADDFMQAFSDPTVNAVVTSIGGDDSVRLIPYLDLSVITNNPKIFLGYSDTTSLHFACFKAGLTSFYGPAVMSGFGENCGPFDYMLKSIRKAVCSSEPMGLLEPNYGGWTVEHLDWANQNNQSIRRKLNSSSGPRLLQGAGIASGHLLGGCAEVMLMLNGSPWWPTLDDWRDAILFYETSEDAPSPALIRYLFRNMATQGILQVLKGILVARPGGQLPIERHRDYEEEIIKVLLEEGLTDLPVIANMDFGHTDPIMTLPYGVTAEIDCDKIEVRIMEASTV
jgi:muramoyltetrapeptide carboxypeptidase LdcA involved in peptidoglycan recycling